jgi:hypothetical protein
MVFDTSEHRNLWRKKGKGVAGDPFEYVAGDLLGYVAVKGMWRKGDRPGRVPESLRCSLGNI